MKLSKVVMTVFLCLLTILPITARGRQEKGGAEGDQGPVTLKLSIFQGGYGREYWDAVAARFEEQNPNVSVEVNANPQIAEIIRTDMLSGNIADFIYLPMFDPVAQSLATDRALEDITDVLMSIEDKFLDGAFDFPSVSPYSDGRLYAAPFVTTAMGLWYNKNYIEGKNITLPKTWDDFFSLKEVITDRDIFTYQGIYPGYLTCFIPAVFASAEGGEELVDRLFSYDPTVFDEPEFQRVLEILGRMKTEGVLTAGILGMDHTISQSAWLDGQAAFIPVGAWIANEMKDAPREKGFVYGMAAAPAVNNRGIQYVSTKIEEMFIPRDAENKELAKKFMLFLYERENLELQAKLTQSNPPVKDIVEIIRPHVDPAVTASLEILKKDNIRSLTNDFALVSGMSAAPSTTFYEQMGALINGLQTPSEVTEKMKGVFEEANALLKAN